MPGLAGLLALLLALPIGAQTRSGAPVVTPAGRNTAAPAASGVAQPLSTLPAPVAFPAVAAPRAAPAPVIAVSAKAPAKALAGGVASAGAERLAAPLPETLQAGSNAPASALKDEADSDWALRVGEKAPKLSVLMVGSESVPYVKTGGLADVIDAVSRGLAGRGHEVALVLPKYPQLDAAKHGFERSGVEIQVPLGDRVERAGLWKGRRGGVDVYLLENDSLHSPEGYYAPRFPGYSDDDERFIFLARGALEAAKALGLKPDVVHAHDWHSALVAPMLKLLYASDPAVAAARSVLTLHNLAYQGHFPFETLARAGFDAKDFTFDRLEHHGKFNFLKAGLSFADALTTVSPTYAREIQGSNEFGRGLEGLLSFRAADLHGILNGVDPELFDPASDRLIARTFTAADVTRGKAANKAALQRETGLDLDPDAPLFAIASRFDHQKGLDLVADAIPALVAGGAQLVISGSGDPGITERFRELTRLYPRQVHLHPFSETFVHRVYAAADFTLMPSRFEPCGLTQLLSQRYGTLPIVARTGGLADTVTDFDADAKRGDGFFLRELSAEGLLEAAGRAKGLMARRGAFLRARRTAMAKDSSWASAIEQYERLFLRLVAGRARG